MSIEDEKTEFIARALAADDGDDWNEIDIDSKEWWLRLARVSEIAYRQWHRERSFTPQP